MISVVQVSAKPVPLLSNRRCGFFAFASCQRGAGWRAKLVWVRNPNTHLRFAVSTARQRRLSTRAAQKGSRGQGFPGKPASGRGDRVFRAAGGGKGEHHEPVHVTGDQFHNGEDTSKDGHPIGENAEGGEKR